MSLNEYHNLTPCISLINYSKFCLNEVFGNAYLWPHASPNNSWGQIQTTSAGFDGIGPTTSVQKVRFIT